MIGLTYGVLPTREQFSAAFDRECPEGYRISLSRSDSRACDGFRLGDGTWAEEELWAAVVEIVTCEDDSDDSDDQNQVEVPQALDLVSAIMETLGFEWI